MEQSVIIIIIKCATAPDQPEMATETFEGWNDRSAAILRNGWSDRKHWFVISSLHTAIINLDGPCPWHSSHCTQKWMNAS